MNKSQLMTNQEILTKAIEKAIAGGFKWPYTGCSDEPLVTDGGNLIPMLNLPTLHWIIFNHDFAKALWGEAVLKFSPTDFTGPEDFNKEFFELPAYKYHLQRMVIADDPIKYLGDNI